VLDGFGSFCRHGRPINAVIVKDNMRTTRGFEIVVLNNGKAKSSELLPETMDVFHAILELDNLEMTTATLSDTLHSLLDFRFS
jgi:hypothetical protein